MFERRKRNGLIGRLIKRAGLPKDGLAVFLVAPVAMANYPEGAELPFLPPKIGQREIWRVTERYVDKRVGDLDSLYRALYG